MWLGRISNRLVKNAEKYSQKDEDDIKPKFICGNELSIADFSVGALFNSIFLNKNNELYDKAHSIYVGFGPIVEYMKHFNHNVMADHLATRPSHRTL